MTFRKLIRIITIVLLSGSLYLEAGESLKLLPEAVEWGTAGAAFVAARKLDHIPVWHHSSIFTGTTDKEFRENTVSEMQLYAAAGLTTLGIGLIPNNEGWLKPSSYHHAKGILESLSATYLITNITKNLFGRQRPSFKSYPAEEHLDAEKSFPSGHASISFAIASYSSLYIFDHIGEWNNPSEKSGKWLYLIVSHLSAGYVGYTRITDNRHFLSDVVAGGVLGSGLAVIVYSYQNSKCTGNNDDSSLQKKETPIFLTFSVPF